MSKNYLSAGWRTPKHGCATNTEYPPRWGTEEPHFLPSPLLVSPFDFTYGG